MYLEVRLNVSFETNISFFFIKLVSDKKGIELLAAVLSGLFGVGWINGLWHFMLLYGSTEIV